MAVRDSGESLGETSIVGPQHLDYEVQRRVFNGLIDRHPAAIVKCKSHSDVISAVRIARERKWKIAVRGGGHSVAGFGTCDDGLVIDLSLMRRVRVDAENRIATVEGGALWSDVDKATQKFGLAVPGGEISTTGVGGLTLGGGHGRLSRAYGLTADSLLAANVVTADGTSVETSSNLEPELWWALRGGGGNFGVVTSFTFALHRVPKYVLGGLLIFGPERALEAMNLYLWWAKNAPRTMSLEFIAFTAPDLPEVPKRLRGRPAVAVTVFAFKDIDGGRNVLEYMCMTAPPDANTVDTTLYVDYQRSLDRNHPPGMRNYWTAVGQSELNITSARMFLDSIFPLPSLHSLVLLMRWDAAICDPVPESSAVPRRRPSWVVHAMAVWSDDAADERAIGWARNVSAAVSPADDPYLNYVGARSGGQVAAYFGEDRYARLVAVKSAWDPDNIFCHNHNVVPPPGGTNSVSA
ncbi:FAD-binding oxidoreductase [Streptomyces sp. NPDC057686]|uniref:FAD-binding oxidoreductase n=1 Tax=Streptomyces sp. NPDC057686 TaxID=3346212 RepID=UPI0036AE8627